MRFSRNLTMDSDRFPLPARLLVLFLVWLGFISWLHFRLNNKSMDRQVVRMGYMPVVTNLAAPLLDHVTQNSTGIHFQAVKFASFSEMAEALRNDSIQVAFIIAPLALVLHQQGVDVKVVLIGNRHESTLVARKNLNVTQVEDLSGGTIAVPMRYSGHNLSLLKIIEEKGLGKNIRVVEMNPPDMASALASGALDAYFVGEPFAAQTVLSDDAGIVAYAESMWPNFICNLVIAKNSWLETNPAVAEKLVETAARSGIWADRNPDDAARIASGYWNQSVDLVRYTLTNPNRRVVYDRFVPKEDELQAMADLMVHYDMIKGANISGLVEDRFALAASLDGIDNLKSILDVN